MKMKGLRSGEMASAAGGIFTLSGRAQRDLLTCSLYSVYGEERYNLFEDTALSGQRDTWRETEFSGQAASFFTAFDPQRHQMVLSGEAEIYDFLHEGLFRLQELAPRSVRKSTFRMR